MLGRVGGRQSAGDVRAVGSGGDISAPTPRPRLPSPATPRPRSLPRYCTTTNFQNHNNTQMPSLARKKLVLHEFSTGSRIAAGMLMLMLI